MNLLDILNNALVGKEVTGGKVPHNMLGTTIVSVRLNNYEPMFEVACRHPGKFGALEIFDILDDWDIEVK